MKNGKGSDVSHMNLSLLNSNIVDHKNTKATYKAGCTMLTVISSYSNEKILYELMFERARRRLEQKNL